MLSFSFTDYSIKQKLNRKINIEDVVGHIKFYGNEGDPRPLKEQFHHWYSHGGGWNPFTEFAFNKETKSLTYPEDPPLYPIVEAKFRDQMIYIYNHSWVNIINPDGTFEVSRMD